MDNGNTATQVSPVPSETEMNSFKQMLDRALNAIVQASELAKVVEGLKADLDGLKHEIQTVRDNNRWLDEQLTRVRTERDEANTQLSQTKNDLAIAVNEHAKVESENTSLKNELTDIRSQLDQAKRERDDYGMKQMQAEEEAKQAKEKLEGIQKLLGMAKPEEPKAAEPVGQPAEPYSPPKHRVYENEAGYNSWKTGLWDSERQLSYQEV